MSRAAERPNGQLLAQVLLHRALRVDRDVVQPVRDSSFGVRASRV